MIPREKIDTPEDLSTKHLPLLQKMKEIASVMMSRHICVEFKVGFHSVPSMLQLHLHVISVDFQSQYMKKPINWNSFNTRYFVHVDDIIERLKETGRFAVDNTVKQVLWGPMQCNKCKFVFSSMSKLKSHLMYHKV